MLKRFLPFFVTLMAVGFTLQPAHAGLVSTAEVHQGTLVQLQAMPEKRDWLQQQLVLGGVEQGLAVERVAALTDDQVNQVYQQLDEQPAGGNVLVAIILIFMITDIFGVTDIFPFIRPLNR